MVTFITDSLILQCCKTHKAETFYLGVKMSYRRHHPSQGRKTVDISSTH